MSDDKIKAQKADSNPNIKVQFQIADYDIVYDPKNIPSLNLLFINQNNEMIEHLNDSDSDVLSCAENAYEYYSDRK